MTEWLATRTSSLRLEVIEAEDGQPRFGASVCAVSFHLAHAGSSEERAQASLVVYMGDPT